MAAVIERYLGISIECPGGTHSGTVTDLQASWNTPAQLWIDTLDDTAKCFIYFSETQGNIAFFDWSPEACNVDINVVDLFDPNLMVSLAVSQKATPILTIPGCYPLGLAANGAATLNVKSIGGRLVYVGGKYYTILYTA
jgi:hypothetical protein